MKISERFTLGKSQYELDFVDIDYDRDTPLFLDPYFLARHDDPWSIDASRAIRSFFEQFVILVRSGKKDEARALFEHLGEPNETCLGMSKGRPRGRGIGDENADDIFDSLLKSRAIETGIVDHLEDTRIFVRNIDKDKVSDMATNILRGHLLEYTRNQCRLLGIPLQPNAPAGLVWSPKTRCWEPYIGEVLIVDGKRLLLVPKAVVSFSEKYTSKEYHQHFVLNFLQHEHLRMNSALVQRRVLRNGSEKRWVTKKSIEATEAPLTKEFLATFTRSHPDVFKNFRDKTRAKVKRLVNENLTPQRVEDVADHLITSLKNIPPGPENATAYHRLVAGILELIFYPNLFAPQVEREIHDGRKRIDITFDNGAEVGFFHRLHSTHKLPSSYIMVECKNYGRDIANPELDQISGRFSPNRGKVGLVVCRTVEDMELLLNRCADTYRDNRGLILPLVDSDLIAVLELLRAGQGGGEEAILEDRMRQIALS